MGKAMLIKRVNAMTPDYEIMFAERGGITPSNPLEFHLYHLARYWNRLVGFCKQDQPSKVEAWLDTDLGACVEVGSTSANKLIDPQSPIHEKWQNYWTLKQVILYTRPVLMADVEAASLAFNDCLNEIKYDPWKLKTATSYVSSQKLDRNERAE